MARNPLLDFIDPGNAAGSVPPPDSPWPQIEPSPVWHYCAVCNKRFANSDALFEHRFAEHPFRRPALLLQGREVTVPRQTIVRPLESSGLSVAHADRILLDGVAVGIDQLRRALAGEKGKLRSVQLENAGVVANFELDFDIADAAELAAADKLFFQVVGVDLLDVHGIGRFISAAAPLRSVARYVAGLSNYLYGVLAKDQRGETTLPRAAYEEKFNMALDAMKDFDTPLARTVVAVVNFNVNVFGDGSGLEAAPALMHAVRRFGAMEQGEEFSGPSRSGSSAPTGVPLDHATGHLIAWALEKADDLYAQREHLRATMNDPSWTPADRFKARMLLADTLSVKGKASQARDLVRGLQNDAVVGQWAQRILGADG